jgi:hypothetical protein
VIKFKTLTTAETLRLLQEKYPLVPAERIQEAANLAFGLPGRAIRFMEDETAFQRVLDLFERVRNVLKSGDIVTKFSLVAEVTQDDELFREFFDIFLLALRYTMLDEADRGESPQKLRNTVATLLQAQKALHLQKRNINARLLFEYLMLQT